YLFRRFFLGRRLLLPPTASARDRRTSLLPVRVKNLHEITRELRAFDDEPGIAIVMDSLGRPVLTAHDDRLAVDDEPLVVDGGLKPDVGGEIDALRLHLLHPF